MWRSPGQRTTDHAELGGMATTKIVIGHVREKSLRTLTCQSEPEPVQRAIGAFREEHVRDLIQQ